MDRLRIKPGVSEWVRAQAAAQSYSPDEWLVRELCPRGDIDFDLIQGLEEAGRRWVVEASIEPLR